MEPEASVMAPSAPKAATSAETRTNRRSVRRILTTGVFWRILVIEMILLMWSLGYRAFTQQSTSAELFWYAVRILILITIIIAFVTLTLRSYLNRTIIMPLEAVSRANRHLNTDAPEVNPVSLPDETPDEIVEIVDTRQRMLEAILKVSGERLRLVNFIRDTFGRYLSKKVVDEILASPDGHKIGGRRETVTILMADLRGFSRFAENYDPEQTMALVNRFFGEMAKIILSYDGMIDEFLGDGILTIFGVPEKHPDDPARTVACALEMQNRMIKLNESLSAKGYPPLAMGIGIHTGTVIVGNIGSEIRAKYGIVGNTVNIAARIESITTGGQVFISDATYRLVAEQVSAASPTTIMMKGLAKPLVCYAVYAIQAPYYVSQERHSPDTPPVEIHLPLMCWMIDDKKVVEPGIEGETRSFDGDDILIRTVDGLPPQTDVKIQLHFCDQAHCFEAIYAKVLDKRSEDSTLHRLRITSIAPSDLQILQQWVAEA
jgi:adenylate cyclase